jgi:CpeT protein
MKENQLNTMQMVRSFICSLVFTVMFAGVAEGQPLTAKDIKKLASCMAGEFTSKAQAQQDTSYFEIILRMKPIWKNRTDGHWLYVEQSLASKQEKPYRQRVYHLYRGDDSTVVSKVYEIKNPLKYTRGWEDAKLLQGLTPDSLVDRQGCAISQHPRGKGVFSGATPGKECLSTLRGAAYATSEVTVSADRLISWDRGWNKEDQQVWGAEKGGYVFIKERSFK